MAQSIENRDLKILPGARHRATHQASVDAILSPMSIHRRVVSSGDSFFNADNWYVRVFANIFCDWHKFQKSNPVVMSDADIHNMIEESSKDKVDDPYINIGETPDDLPVSLASALIGGAYHEAWHTKYAHKKTVTSAIVRSIVVPRINKAPWGNLKEQLLRWMNLVEDIRIERVGCEDFVGAVGRMEDLQDFVLGKEAEVFLQQKPSSGDIIEAVFRDLGKGYNTPSVANALKDYKKFDSTAYDLVVHGPLNDLLRKAQRLGAGDYAGCLEIAMDIIITCVNLSKDDSAASAAASAIDNNKNKSNGDQRNDSNGPAKDNSSDSDDSSSGSPDKESGNTKQTSSSDVKNAAKDTLTKDAANSRTLTEISDAFKKAIHDLLGGKKITKRGANMYRPFSTAFDKIVDVRPTSGINVTACHSEVRNQTNYLRTRLRHLFRATELVDIEHGMKFGRHISNRMIAESVATVRTGFRPDRPFYNTSEAPDMSMSAVIVVDESSSMRSRLRDTCKVLLCLAESLDSIGCKTAIVGFMKSDDYSVYDLYAAQASNGISYHRWHPMVYHLFKMFDERFQIIKPRFGSLTASGDTPMGDGINFGLNLLSSRNEGHRFIFVLTDGQPDDSGPVNNRLDLAKTIGVKVVGVGLGKDAEYVEKCFPESVWSMDIAALPPLIVQKVTQIVERNESKRGSRLAKDQAFGI